MLSELQQQLSGSHTLAKAKGLPVLKIKKKPEATVSKAPVQGEKNKTKQSRFILSPDSVLISSINC